MKKILAVLSLFSVPAFASAGGCPPIVSQFQFQSFATPVFATHVFGFAPVFAVGAPPVIFAQPIVVQRNIVVRRNVVQRNVVLRRNIQVQSNVIRQRGVFSNRQVIRQRTIIR
jgi:hypothetical protein